MTHNPYEFLLTAQPNVDTPDSNLPDSYLFPSDKLNLFVGFFKYKGADFLVVSRAGDDKEISLKRDKEWAGKR